MRTQSPCMNCGKRGCGAYHDVCEVYQQYVNENRRINAILSKERKEREDDLIARGIIKNYIEKSKKGKRR